MLAWLLFISYASLHAQVSTIEKSDSFDVPVKGWNKVLLLKNGNTFFFHFTRKDGIEVNVFDKSRKIIANKTLTSDLWNAKRMSSSIVEGLYEINGEPVLFLAQVEGREPVLYRLRFNATTGDIVKEEEIGTLPKMRITFGAASENIYVEKDTRSECYAVIYFNGSARDKDDRIKVVHYNGEHKVLNSAFYESPEESFRYLNFIGAVVDGDKRVFISTYGARSLKGTDAHVFISRLNATDSVFFNKTLDFTEDFKDTKSVMYYNRSTGLIQLLSLSYAAGRGGVGYYSTFLSYIDPETLGLKGVKPIVAEKINDYAHNTLEIKRNYQGMPQTMIVNPDNSTTILFEEMTQHTVVNQNNVVVFANTTLGAIGVSELDENGNEHSGYVLIKQQLAAGIVDPLYMSARRKGKWVSSPMYADYNSYLSYDYINTAKNRYIIFNDNPNNFEKDEDERRRSAVVSTNKLNTVCYSLNGPAVTKSYLFGNPESKDQSNTCYIEASDYMAGTNTYATIVIERDGRDKQARMVWIHFN